MRKKSALLPVLLLIPVLATGCGGRNKEVQTEPPAVESETASAVPIQQQTQAATEPQTEAQTEPKETEAPEKTLEELQAMFKDRGRTGKIQYEIITQEGKQTGNGTYFTNEGAYELKENDESIAYAFDDASYVKKKEGGWSEGDVLYRDLMDVFKTEGNASVSEVTSMEGTRIYKVGLADTTQVAGEALLPVNLWYSEVEATKSAVLYYLDDAANLKRIDVSIAFTGLKGGSYVEGKFNCVYSVDAFYEETPDVPDEVLQEVYPDYTPGTLDGSLYQNELFDLKVAGKELLTFDTVKTDAMNQDYKNKGMGYVQEAVGNCEGGIVSISSAKFSSASNVADAMAKYLKDCNAQDVGAAENVQFNGKDTIRCSATINGTSTYTYCLTEGGRILFFTIYYKEESTVDAVNGCVYRMWEDPYWEEASWTLDGQYTVYTPKNYTVDLANSSDIYLCLKKGSLEVNAFALTNTDVETQLNKDLEATEGSIPELAYSEDLEVNGQYVKYAVISEKSKGSNYFTYELLQPAGTDVLKYFVVSLDGDGDYKGELTAIAEKTQIPQPGTETEAVEGTVSSEAVMQEAE